MTVELMRGLLGWCAVINLGLLILWFLFLVVAQDRIYRIHSKWFKMPVETFNAIHYAGMAAFKTAIFFFNVIPYIALRIVG